MLSKNQRMSLLTLAMTAALAVPAAWSQNQNQYDQQQRDRFAPDRQQYNEQNDEQSYNQRDRVRDDENNNRGQSGRFDDRSQSRDSTYSNSDRSGSERRQDRRAERNNEDGPAGLGVMLDSSGGAIEVREVARRSPADRAGIERGDQIISVNGRQIDSPEQLTQLIRQQEPGSQVDIRIRRDGQQQTVSAELESMREALDSLDRGRSESWQDEEEFYSNSPPWSDDELMQHVDQLEQQVNAMREQINDLRKMLDSDPSEQRFSQRNQRRD